MDELSLYSPDYATARSRFRDTAQGTGWNCIAYPIAGIGPHGEALAVDVAVSPQSNSEQVVVISSGIHGVEGHFGSAVQLAVLDEWQRTYLNRSSARIVLIHALNPYGFAWSRRVDAENIDPNRNFLCDGDAYHGSPPHYSDFDRMLNPRRPPTWHDRFFLDGIWPLLRYGKAALKTVIASGQYDYPHGLFFGGNSPSQTFQIVRQHIRSWIGRATNVVHLDLHTGLGPWGTYKLLVDDQRSSVRLNQMVRASDPAVDANAVQAIPYRVRGSFGAWCATQNLAPEYSFAFAEFGSYSDVSVISGLRMENQSHHWGTPHSTRTKNAKSRLRELFCPSSPSWRARVIHECVDLVKMAVQNPATRRQAA